MSDDILDRIAKALEGVTPAPWMREDTYVHAKYEHALDGCRCGEQLEFYHGHLICESVFHGPDQGFIAAARSLVPECVDEIRTMRSQLDDIFRAWNEENEKYLDTTDRLDAAQAEIATLRAKLDSAKTVVSEIQDAARAALEVGSIPPGARGWLADKRKAALAWLGMGPS